MVQAHLGSQSSDFSEHQPPGFETHPEIRVWCDSLRMGSQQRPLGKRGSSSEMGKDLSKAAIPKVLASASLQGEFWSVNLASEFIPNQGKGVGFLGW